jgi:hypothetical protein
MNFFFLQICYDFFELIFLNLFEIENLTKATVLVKVKIIM